MHDDIVCFTFLDLWKVNFEGCQLPPRVSFISELSPPSNALTRAASTHSMSSACSDAASVATSVAASTTVSRTQDEQLMRAALQDRKFQIFCKRRNLIVDVLDGGKLLCTDARMSKSAGLSFDETPFPD